MKRGNELLVGATMLVAAAIVVAGALWLSETRLGAQETVHPARFRTVGGLGVGAPVVLRGVRVGRVESIRLSGEDWVEADLRITEDVELPARPAVIAASASLFGEWAAAIVSLDNPPDDPNVLNLLLEAARAGGDAWPGATLPDVGQLTAQAGRIASDIAVLTNRVGAVFDSTVAAELRSSIRDFVEVANQLQRFSSEQISTFERIAQNVDAGSGDMAQAARGFRQTMARADSATGNGRLEALFESARSSSEDLRQASTDLRSLMTAARAHETSLVRVLVATDSVLSRLEAGTGTLGLLARDSALYQETTATMQQLRTLLVDIQANPRRYFKFSVF